VVANIFFIIVSHNLIDKYVNTFAINVGYVFLFSTISWVADVIYFVELINFYPLPEKIKIKDK
jgi:hypothetical protein